MSVESRLRKAGAELEEVVGRAEIPELGGHGKPRAVLAGLASGALVVMVVVLASLLLPALTPEEATTRLSPPDSTTNADPSAVSLGPTGVQRMLGSIVVIDPEKTRQRTVDALEFDADDYGLEYRLVRLDDPESIRSWFLPTVPTTPSPWDWTVVGQVDGFDMPVVVARSGGESAVCAGLESGAMSCAGGGFQALSADEYSPAVWLVPEGTALVVFAEHDQSGWQIPSGGAVAFPRLDLSSHAVLKALNMKGELVGRTEFRMLTEVNEQFQPLPGPAAADLLRILVGRRVTTVAETILISDRHEAAESLLGVAQAASVKFLHLDGSESFAILVGDDVRGVALWSRDPSTLSEKISVDLSPENLGDIEVADDGDLLIVSRGLTINHVVAGWNDTIDG